MSLEIEDVDELMKSKEDIQKIMNSPQPPPGMALGAPGQAGMPPNGSAPPVMPSGGSGMPPQGMGAIK